MSRNYLIVIFIIFLILCACSDSKLQGDILENLLKPLEESIIAQDVDAIAPYLHDPIVIRNGEGEEVKTLKKVDFLVEIMEKLVNIKEMEEYHIKDPNIMISYPSAIIRGLGTYRIITYGDQSREDSWKIFMVVVKKGDRWLITDTTPLPW